MFKIRSVILIGFLFSDCFAGCDLDTINYLNSLIPNGTQLRKRVLTAICCDDCRMLPKVEKAGKLFSEEDGLEYQLMHNGLKIVKDCYYGSWMTTLIQLLQGHHEPQEEKAFYEVLAYMPANAVMLELGSYWGYYSMWFQRQVPGAQNFLIEPDPKNLIIGQKNFALNNMKGFFTRAMIGTTSKASQPFTDWDFHTYEVKQVCIDDFAAENSIPFIHILHSDIQGAEVDMLKGCQRLIGEKRIGYFFISTHRGKHEECCRILVEGGYEILVSVTREESFTADGLIVAKLPLIKGPSCLEVSKRTSQLCMFIDGVKGE